MADLSKGQRDYYAFGDWNIACSMCGRKRKASEVVRNWMGMYRCPEHNEPRHPQDFVRGEADIQTAPFALDQSDSSDGPGSTTCWLNGLSAVPYWAAPGCMIPGRSIVDPTGFDPNGTLPPPPPEG